MNKKLQELIFNLPSNNIVLLTTLLSERNHENWENNKHLIVCNMPLLTLEMAVNKVGSLMQGVIPEPKLIHAALIYAQDERAQYLSQNRLKLVANG